MEKELFYGGITVGTSNRILYTASGFAKSSLLYLQEVGELWAEHPQVSKRDGLASYLFFMVVSGSGELTYNGEIHPLTAGDCIFIDCRKPYSHATFDELWKLKWCHFHGPNMTTIYEKYVERGGRPHFRPKDPVPFDTLLDEIYRIAGSSDYIRDMKLNEKLTSLLTLLMQESWRSEDQRGNAKKQHMLPVKNHLDEHYPEKITLDALSELFYINKFYLMRQFKEQYGLSVNSYLLQVRITKAKQLLRFTDKTVEVIGLECGLGAPSYFSRIFKKVEGIAPSEFRAQWERTIPSHPF